MKKGLLFGFAAALTLASCTTNDEVLEVAKQQEMSFTTFVDKATKGAIESLETDNATMGVWGYKVNVKGETHPVFASQKTVDGNDDAQLVTRGVDVKEGETKLGTWSYSPLRYWDITSSYTFYAVAPFKYIEEDKGLIGATCTNAGVITINDFELSSSQANTVDLLVATKFAQSKEQVAQNPTINYTFNHVLSKINFKFTKNTGDETVKVDYMNLKGVLSKANCTYTHGGTPVITWTTPTIAKNYECDLLTAPNTITTSDAFINGLTDLLVIPQTPTELTIDVTYWIGSEKFIKTGIALPTDYAWNPNMNITYNIVISYSTAGNPISFGPTTVTGWTDATKQPDNTETTGNN